MRTEQTFVFERLLRIALLSFDRCRSAAVDGHKLTVGIERFA